MKSYFELWLLLILPLLFNTFTGCLIPINHSDKIETGSYEVLKIYSHDKNAQTEGLIFMDGFLYEGTGPGPGTPSTLRKTDLESGKVLQILELPEPLFGEGITIIGNRIFQLTYRSNIGFVYDKKSFRLLKTFSFQGEGWGLATDGNFLIMSNGTSILRYLDPVTFETVRTLEVRDDNGPLNNLNELEIIKEEIYANVYETSRIVRIAPKTGLVTGTIDLSTILKKHFFDPHIIDLANGIAYDPDTGHLFVTGKYWPHLFEIRLDPQGG